MRLGTMNHLRVTVSDWTQSRPFYDAILGFLGYHFLNENEDRACYEAGSVPGAPEFVLISEAYPQFRRETFELGRLGLHHIAFNADSRQEVDEMYQLLIRLGVPNQGPPAEYEYGPGYYAVYFRDPNNIKFELVHRPSLDHSAGRAVFP